MLSTQNPVEYSGCYRLLTVPCTDGQTRCIRKAKVAACKHALYGLSQMTRNASINQSAAIKECDESIRIRTVVEDISISCRVGGSE